MSKRALIIFGLVAVGVCFAQFRQRPGRFDQGGTSGNFVRIEGGLVVNEDELRTARETDSHSSGTPNWTNEPGFEQDVFTFTRVIFKSDPGSRSDGARLRWLGWWVDYPDADLNLSFRLHQLTSIRTDPDARVLKFSDPGICDYPLLYIEHAGYMRLAEEEAGALRRYLASGGALLVNDFWGEDEWNGFAREMKRVLPGRTWTELSTNHNVFHCVYDLRLPMRKMQVPTIQFWNSRYEDSEPQSQLQTIYRGEGADQMHVRALLDDRQRIMVLAILNSDVSDGWEREGENETYFNRFSERIAYPLAINVIFYLMTH